MRRKNVVSTPLGTTSTESRGQGAEGASIGLGDGNDGVDVPADGRLEGDRRMYCMKE